MAEEAEGQDTGAEASASGVDPTAMALVMGGAKPRWGYPLALLSFAAGSMDAIGFLTLGNVFTSAMSGNAILLGLALGQGRISAATHSLAAFVGYVVGVVIATLPLQMPKHGIERALALECLFLAAFAGLWITFRGPVSPLEIYALIILSSIAMGLQGAVGRAIRIPGIPTIVITRTLTAIIGTVAERLLAGDRPIFTAPTSLQVGTFLAYLASAAVTGFAVSRYSTATALIPLMCALALVLGLELRLPGYGDVL